MSGERQEANRLIDSYALDFDKDNPYGYESYQKLLAPMFAVEGERHQPFESSSRTYMFKDMIFASSIANTINNTLVRDASLAILPGEDIVVILFYKEHPITIVTDLSEQHVEPEQLVFLDLSKAITIKTQGINVLSINISRSLLASLIPAGTDIHGLVARDGAHKELLVSYMKTLELVAGQVQVNESVHVTETVVRMIANCLLQHHGNKTAGSATNLKLSLLQVKQAIDAQIEDPRLSPETLMEQFHVSRATIYRMFEPLGGVAKYIQSRKLDFAFRELSKYTDKKQNISMLAYRLGFSHASVFTRAFFAKFGINPTDVRAKMGKREKQAIPWHFEIDLDPFKK